MAKRYIKIGRNTAAHGAKLKELGYEVEEENGHFVIEASEVVENADFSTPDKGKELIAAMVKDKKVFSYKTKFDFGGGRILTSIMACTELGPASALVTKAPPKAKRTRPGWNL
jgi:hypothetical protein